MKRNKNLILFSLLLIFVKFILMRTKAFKMFSKFIFELAIRFKDYAVHFLTRSSSGGAIALQKA